MIIDITQSKIERKLRREEQIICWNNFLKMFDEVAVEIELERSNLAAGGER